MNYTITNPKGIDVAIQKLQTLLYNNLGWNDIDVFGRVYRNVNQEKGFVPEAFIEGGEYKDVLTNDNKTATVFFIEDNKHEAKEGLRFENKVKIVFIVNLEKAYTGSTARVDVESEIKAIELLNNKSFFRITEIEKGIDSILSSFNTDYIKLSDMQPFHIFSINGIITYQLNNCF